MTVHIWIHGLFFVLQGNKQLVLWPHFFNSTDEQVLFRLFGSPLSMGPQCTVWYNSVNLLT